MDAETARRQLINHLPVEILGEILLWAGANHWARRGSQGPWYIGHVCGLWRSIVLALPQLWAEVWISNFGETALSWSIRMAELEEHFLRSANTLLSVYIFWAEDLPLERNMLLMELVLRHCERWRSLVIVLSSDIDGLFKLLAPAKNRLPVLEKLDLDFSWSGHVQSEVFLHAPKLVDLAYRGHGAGIQLPWNQIQICYFAGSIGDHIALQSAQNLVSLHLNVESGRPPPGVPIALPRLRHLCCSGGTDLINLAAPVLESLFLGVGSHLDLVSKFLARSRCPLKRLLVKEDIAGDYYVGRPVTDMKSVIGMLQRTPSLEVLILVASSWPEVPDSASDDSDADEYPSPEPDVDSLFDALQLTGSQLDIVPNLSTFVYGLPYDPIVWNSFMAMARSRSFASARFLGSWDLSDVFVEQNVKEIKREELRMLVTTNFPETWIKPGRI
ncbi:hypothetical protein HMN09_00298200 [Mycena chlorophos]|uniref:F-box domain-containing protein n=1 Tax=Mycena chlorophos TaxID=658473 RepID=A0A8H6TLS2_MYCCL|nr:hypothetical protein HMN09_00298200 [Mycena chlorophos]